MCLKALIALLQFTTILPLGKPVDLSFFAQRLYLYPLAGYVIGGIAALVVFTIDSRTLSAAIALGIVLLLSGFHHFDGLLDLGDALMAHGDRERRIRALTDRQVGAGGMGLGLTITLIAFAALLATPLTGVVILAGEVAGKVGMTSLSIFGRPFKEGLHAFLHQHVRKWFILPALCFFLPLAVILPWNMVIVVAMVTLLTAALVLYLSLQLFDGVNGDVVGAANEIIRCMVMVTLAVML